MMDRAKLLVLIQLVLFLMVAAAFLLLPSRPAGVLWIAGLMLAGGGGLLGMVAIAEHGRHNKRPPRAVPTPSQGAELIRSGPYRCVRHPIYTGVLLAGLGAAVLHGHEALWLLAAALILFFTYKSLYEEQLLQAAYPDYAAYKRGTGRFLPPLRRRCGRE